MVLEAAVSLMAVANVTKDSPITMVSVRDVLLEPSGVPKLLPAFMFAVKTQSTTKWLELVSVTQGMVK